MSKLMISVSGIRGIFGESLTPDLACRYAAHFGILCKRGKIIVGRDSRTTGPLMFHAIVSGLMSVGCDVVDLEIASTPTVLLAVEQSDATGGIAITASHNPANWNAMKLIDANGLFLFPKKAEKFINSLEEPISYVNWEEVGFLTSDETAISRHIDKILAVDYLNIDKIRERRFKVVIDSVNGAGGTISPLLLKSLGCEVVELNSETSGHFAHNPEPQAQHLSQLTNAVIENSADIGFATDPDVDRLVVVSEKGECIGEEYSLLLAEKYVLSKKKGDIVTNLSSSMSSEDIAAQFGVKVNRTKVGEINVGMKMKELGSPIGGEGNGGIICPEVHYTRDAPAGMALILGYLAERDLPISRLADEIPRYYMAKDKLTVKPEALTATMEKAKRIYAHEKTDETDGLKVIGENYWIHIRKSGTEPIIRIYSEGKSAEHARSLCQETKEKLKL
jgi:phosphomannomutase